MDYYTLGQRIRYYRKKQGLSQEQLAEKVNISTTHMSHIENGSTKLSLQVFVDLAEALCIATDSLLYDCDILPSGKETLPHEIAQILSECTLAQTQAIKEIIVSVHDAIEKYL